MNTDLPLLAVVVNRVGEQIGDHLIDPVGVTESRRWFESGLDLDAVLEGEWARAFEAGPGGLRQIEWMTAHWLLTGVEPGEFNTSARMQSPRAVK